MSRLKDEFQRELDEAGIESGSNTAEVGASEIDFGSGKVGLVEQIVELAAEL